MPLPPENLESVKEVGKWMAAFYLCQPFVFYGMLVRQPLYRRIAAFAWFVSTMTILAGRLRDAFGYFYSFNVNIVWWPFGLLFAKYMHALTSSRFAETLGLSDLGRLIIFCYAPATVVFADKPDNSATSSRIYSAYLVGRGVLQLLVMGTIAALIVEYDLESRLASQFLSNILAFYQVCLSQGGLSDIAFSATTRLIVGDNVRMLEPSDAPWLATSPRFFWQRWSKSTGFHFRQAIYEPLGGRNNQWWATFCTFGINGFLHVVWWGPISANKIAWNYTPVLVIGPMISLVLDKYVLSLLKTSSPRLYHLAGLLSLHVFAGALMGRFLDAQGMPTSLRELALLQLGRL